MEEDRIALFVDYENLALGARDHLGGMTFDLKPIADALAERGRVVVRRAYADWSYFDEDRRMLTRSHVELIEMPQRMGASRKNAADIKMVVDAIEMAFERDYITTFAICTGDSDFTPLVHKLRELNKNVIGVGVRNSTSAMLPPSCDEFLFYDSLDGVDPHTPKEKAAEGKSGRGKKGGASSQGGSGAAGGDTASTPAPKEDSQADGGKSGKSSRGGSTSAPQTTPEGEEVATANQSTGALAPLVAQTVAGLQRTASGPVTASALKRTLLRKDPTFSEADFGFRAFGELLKHLDDRGVITLSDGPSSGDPMVELPGEADREVAFDLLRRVLDEEDPEGDGVPLSGLKDRLRHHEAEFSEKALGYSSFLQFCKAADTEDVAELWWDDDHDGYLVAAL
ncbi:NYN domain-containing protein [Kytococcus sedentarius]|uniref:NYN domain-containing protein n=1 Tax=Kytococcus sedentarius TaxID=1276 RepID=UPI0035BBF1C5